MLIRTHLAITLFFILLFFNHVNNKLVFVLVALIATFLPDVDSSFSVLGKKKGFRVLQFFVKHRGMFHSFSFAILLILPFVLFFPILAFGFFLGYGMHLFADSFTLHGIKPFYPFGRKANWKIISGSRTEIMIFFLFIFLDIFALTLLYVNGRLL